MKGNNCNWCGCSDDEAFIRALVVDVKSKLCINEAQVVMAGMSMGGMFTSWISTRMGDVFSGFAPVSGTNPKGFYEEVDAEADFSILWIHGSYEYEMYIYTAYIYRHMFKYMYL